MVKKLQKMASKKAAPAAFNPAALMDNQVAANVRDSAQQIWAAGLGAFSKAQGEGSKVFDTLVKEGMNLQKKTQSLAEQKFGAVATKMTGMATDVGSKAGQQWDKLEGIFEERVSRALKSLGVPSGLDINALISRIDALSAAVGFAPAKKSKPAAKAVAKAKATAKTVAVKAEKAVAPAKKAAAKPVAAAKKAVAKPVAAVKKAVAKAPAKAAPAQKAVAETKVAVKRAARKTAVVAEKAVEAVKEAVQA
jgi:poly(hydroxyalkanoate) granule-associated protein